MSVPRSPSRLSRAQLLDPSVGAMALEVALQTAFESQVRCAAVNVNLLTWHTSSSCDTTNGQTPRAAPILPPTHHLGTPGPRTHREIKNTRPGLDIRIQTQSESIRIVSDDPVTVFQYPIRSE